MWAHVFFLWHFLTGQEYRKELSGSLQGGKQVNKCFHVGLIPSFRSYFEVNEHLPRLLIFKTGDTTNMYKVLRVCVAPPASLFQQFVAKTGHYLLKAFRPLRAMFQLILSQKKKQASNTPRHRDLFRVVMNVGVFLDLPI